MVCVAGSRFRLSLISPSREEVEIKALWLRPLSVSAQSVFRSRDILKDSCFVGSPPLLAPGSLRLQRRLKGGASQGLRPSGMSSFQVRKSLYEADSLPTGHEHVNVKYAIGYDCRSGIAELQGRSRVFIVEADRAIGRKHPSASVRGALARGLHPARTRGYPGAWPESREHRGAWVRALRTGEQMIIKRFEAIAVHAIFALSSTALVTIWAWGHKV